MIAGVGGVSPTPDNPPPLSCAKYAADFALAYFHFNG